MMKLINERKRPHGKESIEVWKSQIKGKESENSYQELFTLFWLRKTAVPVQISGFSFRVFVCACPFRDLFNSW